MPRGEKFHTNNLHNQEHLKPQKKSSKILVVLNTYVKQKYYSPPNSFYVTCCGAQGGTITTQPYPWDGPDFARGTEDRGLGGGPHKI